MQQEKEIIGIFMEVAIIGGGASGMTCAIAIKQNQKNIAVTVYEKLPKVLKKILVTGNGRCNLTNLNAAVDCYWGNADVVKLALQQFSPQSNISFFKDIGLITKVEDEGRVYPLSSQATSVANVLRLEAERLGVKVLTDIKITEIEKRNDSFILNRKYKSDCVVVSSGGSAAASQGTDGDSFRLLEKLGINIIPPRPALVAVNARNFTKSLKGVRNICFVRLFIDDKELYSEKGEVQFTDYGLSGIPIMQLSGLIACSESDNVVIELDCLPQLSKAEVLSFIFNRIKKNPQLTVQNAVCGILPKALGSYLCKLSDINQDEPIGNISEAKIQHLAELIKSWKISIHSVRDFQFAQVTAGGADCKEFNFTTLECKKIKGLYCVGEALDVYGRCGGYNLQWAWSSARLAAQSIAKENGIVKN